jgi:hypothetical protein
MMPKYTRNLEFGTYVAVIHTATYGSGWSSWALESEQEMLLFEPDIAQILFTKECEKQALKQIHAVYRLKGYQSENLGWQSLQLSWVAEGTEFRIQEYDGLETIVYKHTDVWHMA